MRDQIIATSTRANTPGHAISEPPAWCVVRADIHGQAANPFGREIDHTVIPNVTQPTPETEVYQAAQLRPIILANAQSTEAACPYLGVST